MQMPEQSQSEPCCEPTRSRPGFAQDLASKTASNENRRAIRPESDLLRVAVMGQDGSVLLVVERDGGVVKRCVLKGFAPDDPADPFDQGDGIVGFEEETNGGIGKQRLPAGEADAMVAEVDGPGVVLA